MFPDFNTGVKTRYKKKLLHLKTYSKNPNTKYLQTKKIFKSTSFFMKVILAISSCMQYTKFKKPFPMKMSKKQIFNKHQPKITYVNSQHYKKIFCNTFSSTSK